MDGSLKEYRSQIQAHTHLTVQMDSRIHPNKFPIHFCSFQFPKLKHDPSSIQNTDRASRVL